LENVKHISESKFGGRKMNIGEIILVAIVCVLAVAAFIYSRKAEKYADNAYLRKETKK